MTSRPPRSAPILGVIYDHDGTLVNSLPVVVAATNRALVEHGHAEDAGAAIIAAMVLPTAPRMGHHSGVSDSAGQWRLAHAFYRIARELAGLATLYPGVPELLAACAGRGLPQGVVSNNDGAFVRAVLTGFGLDHHFAALIGEQDMPAPKPDPAGLLLAAGRMARAARRLHLRRRQRQRRHRRARRRHALGGRHLGHPHPRAGARHGLRLGGGAAGGDRGVAGEDLAG